MSSESNEAPVELEPEALELELAALTNEIVAVKMNAYQAFLCLNGLFGLEAQAWRRDNAPMVELTQHMEQTLAGLLAMGPQVARVLALNRAELDLPPLEFRPPPEERRILAP